MCNTIRANKPSVEHVEAGCPSVYVVHTSVSILCAKALGTFLEKVWGTFICHQSESLVASFYLIGELSVLKRCGELSVLKRCGELSVSKRCGELSILKRRGELSALKMCVELLSVIDQNVRSQHFTK
jgi:hypothetical protein